MQIREYTTNDVYSVNDLIRQIQRDEQGLHLEQPELWNIDTVYQVRGNFWIAEQSGMLIGTVGLQLLDREVAKLGKMFVVPSYRGSNKGVAAALLDTAVAYAFEHGVMWICLETIMERCAAHAFYVKHGFEEVEASLLPPTFTICPLPSRYFVRAL